jgi:hypothetical protein
MTLSPSTHDAVVLLYACVEFGKSSPSAAECWVLDAANHLQGRTTFDGHRRVSEWWPDPSVQNQRAAA